MSNYVCIMAENRSFGVDSTFLLSWGPTQEVASPDVWKWGNGRGTTFQLSCAEGAVWLGALPVGRGDQGPHRAAGWARGNASVW